MIIEHSYMHSTIAVRLGAYKSVNGALEPLLPSLLFDGDCKLFFVYLLGEIIVRNCSLKYIIPLPPPPPLFVHGNRPLYYCIDGLSI